MNRHPIFTIILSLTLLLSACVPIPATPPETAPTPETKAGLSDLASALAKADESDDIPRYAQRLDQLNACMLADVANQEDSPEYSDSETVAMSIYFAGVLFMAQFFTQAFEGAMPKTLPPSNLTEDEPSAYEMIDMALIACQQNDLE